jgi:hypothetical protein
VESDGRQLKAVMNAGLENPKKSLVLESIQIRKSATTAVLILSSFHVVKDALEKSVQ